MDTITVQFTQQEADDLTGLLDVAVKALGIRAARPAANLIEKIGAAIDVAAATEKTPEE